MAKVSYNLDLTEDGHVLVQATKKAPNYVYAIGKTRAQLTRDVWFILRVSEVPVNKDRLQNELDDLLWNHVPKHQWY